MFPNELGMTNYFYTIPVDGLRISLLRIFTGIFKDYKACPSVL